MAPSKIWDTRSNQLVQHYAEHDGPVQSIDFHPSGNYLVSASSDNSLKILDLREGHLLYTLQGHTKDANSVAFAPDGSFFASASSDEIVMVWRTNFDRPIEQADRLGSNAEEEEKEKEKVNGSEKRQQVRPKTAPSSSTMSRPKTARGRKPVQQSQPVAAARNETASREEVRASAAQADMSNKLASTMEYIAQQMQIMTKTLSIFEQRLSRNEDTIAQILENQKNLVMHQQANSLGGGGSPGRIHRQVSASTDSSNWGAGR